MLTIKNIHLRPDGLIGARVSVDGNAGASLITAPADTPLSEFVRNTYALMGVEQPTPAQRHAESLQSPVPHSSR